MPARNVPFGADVKTTPSLAMKMLGVASSTASTRRSPRLINCSSVGLRETARTARAHGKQETIINEVLSKQPADGGWSLSSLVGAWKRRDGTPWHTTGNEERRIRNRSDHIRAPTGRYLARRYPREARTDLAGSKPEYLERLL